MRILHLMLACFYVDNYSYQENYLPKYHKAAGHEVEIVASRISFDKNGRPGKLPAKYCGRHINEHGIPVTRLFNKPGRYDALLRRYEGLQAELDRFQPELIFIHGVQFCDISIVAKYCKKNPHVKVFADNHADFSNSATNWVSKNLVHRILWRHCGKKINKYVTRFYGVLPARVDFLINEYKLPKKKIELLVMGGDDESVIAAAKPEVRQEIRAKYGLAEDDFVIMTGGKIDPFKTQTLLLMDAVHRIPDKKVKLIVFGSVVPELQEQVNALCDGEKVQYVGWIKAAESYAMFAAADLVVFPGRHSVFWEQVASQGIPMVVKHWDGTTHVDRGGNVRFLHQDSVEEIYTELQKIVGGDYAEMKAAAEQASGHFLYSKIAKRSIED